MDWYVYFSLFLLTVIIACIYKHGTGQSKQEGGGRKAIFSRFHYEPQFPFMSKFDKYNPNLASKTYNVAGPIRFIVQRPYRNYYMPLGNWGYPWHFPEPIDRHCQYFAADRCDEKLDWQKDMVRPSTCFDSVYKQCRKGINPLLVKIPEKGIYA